MNAEQVSVGSSGCFEERCASDDEDSRIDKQCKGDERDDEFGYAVAKGVADRSEGGFILE